MNKIIVLLVFLFTSVNAIDLPELTMSAEKNKDETTPFESVFEAPEYIEKESYVPNAPGQRRMTAEEAKFIPGAQGDPIKALKILSGITSGNDFSGELLIHGSKPEESLVTINHLPIGYLYHVGGIHSVISPESIEQIDAYLGGFDVTYGNAMGGVIDVTPKYPGVEEAVSSFVHAGLYDASFGLTVGLTDKLSFSLGGRRSYFDLLLPTTGSLDEDTNTSYTKFPNYYDLNFLMSYAPNDNNIYSLEMIAASDSFDISSGANSVKDPEATGQIKGEKDFATFGVRHQSWYGDYSSNTLAYLQISNSKTALFDGYFIDVNEKTYGLYHESVYHLNKHKLVAGLEFVTSRLPVDANISLPPRRDNVGFDFTTATKYQIDTTINAFNTSLFLQDIYSATEDLSFRYGLRFSHSSYQSFGGYADPRASVIYALNDEQHLSFSVGQYTQLPQLVKTLDEITKEKLSYERAYHYNLHYDYILKEGSSFDIEPYYKDYQGLAIDDNTSTYSSGGKGYAYGVDMSLKMREGDYYGYIAYTYLRSKRQLNADDPTLTRFYAEIPHTLQALGSMRLGSNMALSALMKYQSGSPYTEVIGTRTDPLDPTQRIIPIYGDPFEASLPYYFSLNIKIAQELRFNNHTSLEWSFELMNITNHKNVASYRYSDDYKTKIEINQLPLVPWFDVTYRF